MLTDADIEMGDLIDSAEHDSALKRRGICTHGWQQGGVDSAGNLRSGSCVKCLECGGVFASQDAIEHSREMARIEGVLIRPDRYVIQAEADRA